MTASFSKAETMWRTPDPPANEAARIAALVACEIMDTPREERFDRLTWLARRYYSADAAFIGFIDSTHQWIKSMTGLDAMGQTIGRQQSVCQTVVSSGVRLVVGDLKTDPRFTGHPTAPRFPLRFYAGVPLKLEPDLVVGTLCILRREPGDAAAFDADPLEALAAIVVDEIELRAVNRELTRLSRLDALTGLANRRAFDEELARAAARCLRLGEPLSLLLLDLDRFKVLNDLSGHAAGDEALRRVGEALRTCPRRESDLVCRYGGEEFALVAPGLDSADAHALAQRIRTVLASAHIAHPVTGLVTASIGLATQSATIDIRTLIDAADAALYAAKRAGRNTIVGTDQNTTAL